MLPDMHKTFIMHAQHSMLILFLIPYSLLTMIYHYHIRMFEHIICFNLVTDKNISESVF